MAVDMFLVLDKIEGEARDKTHAKQIDVLAWNWGIANNGTTHIGGGGGSGKSSVQDISLTKYIDKASPLLLQCVTKGTHIATGKLIVRKAGDKPLEYIVIELKEIMITSVSFGGSGGEDRLTENVTLNFAEFTYTYTEQAPDGKSAKAPSFGFNIAQNTPI